MKNILRHSLIILTLSLTLTGCEDVINVDLKAAPTLVVIEGRVDADSLHWVQLTKSVPFSETTPAPRVSGAIITIADNQGLWEVLTEISPGLYRSKTMVGVEGCTYSLEVQVEGGHYTAQSTMPYRVQLDSASVLDMPNVSGGRMKMVSPNFLDPAFPGNHYILKTTVIGKSPIYLVINDQFFNGNYVKDFPVSLSPPMEQGDSVVMELRSVDFRAMEYFEALLAGQQGAIPGNPESNIAGGCLGYFSAYASSTQTTVIP